jgi:anti-sigma B factor antagonist
MRGLTIETRDGAGDVLLAVSGEVDMATASELEGALGRALAREGDRLIVDLRGVNFLDSTGLALLLRHGRGAATAGRDLIGVKGPPQVHQVFELTGLDGLLTMLDAPPEMSLPQDPPVLSWQERRTDR